MRESVKESIKKFSKQMSKYFALILVGVLLAGAGFFLGCKTLKVFDDSEIPECNDMYTAMDFTIKNNAKATTLVALAQKECQKARERKRNNECKKWIYGDNPIDKKKFPEYAYFLECIK